MPVDPHQSSGHATTGGLGGLSHDSHGHSLLEGSYVGGSGDPLHPSVQPEPSGSGSAASGSGFFNNSNADAQGSLYMQDAGDARGGGHHHDAPLGGSPTVRILTSSAVEGEDGVYCIPEDWESQLAVPETASEWWPWSM